MKNKVEYNFDVRKDGHKEVFHVEIDFVSMECHEMLYKIELGKMAVLEAWDRISEITSLLVNEKNADKIKELKKEKKECSQIIFDMGESTFFKERFELIKTLLKSNGYDKDFIYDYEFWHKNVDPTQIIEFLGLVSIKDVDKKDKKQKKKR